MKIHVVKAKWTTEKPQILSQRTPDLSMVVFRNYVEVSMFRDMSKDLYRCGYEYFIDDIHGFNGTLMSAELKFGNKLNDYPDYRPWKEMVEELHKKYC